MMINELGFTQWNFDPKFTKAITELIQFGEFQLESTTTCLTMVDIKLEFTLANFKFVKLVEN